MMRKMCWAMLAMLTGSVAVAADMPTYRLELKDGTLNPVRVNVPAAQLRKEKVLAPGAQSSVVIQPLTPGEYKFFDEFHMNTAQGVIVAK